MQGLRRVTSDIKQKFCSLNRIVNIFRQEYSRQTVQIVDDIPQNRRVAYYEQVTTENEYSTP